MDLQTMLAMMKLRLNIDAQDQTQDALFLSFIEQAKGAVMAYCNRDDIPSALELNVVLIALDLYRARGSPQSEREIKSETQGARSVTYRDTEALLDTQIRSHLPALNRWRKTSWR